VTWDYLIRDHKEKTGIYQLETTSMHTEIAHAGVMAIITPGCFSVVLLFAVSFVII
jgi:hypothetical protein